MNCMGSAKTSGASDWYTGVILDEGWLERKRSRAQFAMIRWSCLLIAISTISLSPARAQPDAAGAGSIEKPSVDYWVTQLDNDHFLRREMATKKLIEAGPAAIADLVHVIREGDLEVVERATNAMTEIALSRAPSEDGGAWDQLNRLATQSAGRRAGDREAAPAARRGPGYRCRR